MPPDGLEIDYNGLEANSILSRSLSQWQHALRVGKSIRGFPESSFQLEGLLSRIPALPNDIPSSSTYIEGYSTWKNFDASCPLVDKTETTRRLHLRSLHPTTCKISTSDNFRVWEGNPNNGIVLLVLAWTYILTASLAERQQLSLQYTPLDGPCGSVKINLDYASPQELIWWKAIVARGSGWSITADRYSPWAVLVDDLDLDIVGNIDVIHSPPTASQAAGYLERLCVAYDLGNQCSAALAAALSLPLHSSTAPLKSVTIELPRPLLSSTRVASPGQGHYPTDFRLLGHYMTLSLSPSFFGSALWSIFSEPKVPCNFAGAWLGPISDVLRPILQTNRLELLAKVLSFTNVAPLWLGITLCGQRTIVNSITPFLDELRPYPHTQPFVDAAAWTGAPQSFIDRYPPGPYLQDGRISRANIWRLRHDCHKNYEDDLFSTTPPHGWPPFGTMLVKDVELELLDHLNCSHQWKYDFWTWLPSGIRDTGLSGDERDSPQEPLDRIRIQERETQGSQINYAVSQAATRRVFGWCCNQVERGFGSIVPRRDFNAPVGSAKSNVALDSDAIQKWIKALQ